MKKLIIFLCIGIYAQLVASSTAGGGASAGIYSTLVSSFADDYYNFLRTAEGDSNLYGLITPEAEQNGFKLFGLDHNQVKAVKELVQPQLQDIQNFGLSVLPQWLQEIYQDVTDELIQIVAKGRKSTIMQNHDYFKPEYADIRCGLLKFFIQEIRKQDPAFIPYLYIKKSLLEGKRQEHKDLNIDNPDWNTLYTYYETLLDFSAYEKNFLTLFLDQMKKIIEVRNAFIKKCFFFDSEQMYRPINDNASYVIIRPDLLRDQEKMNSLKDLFDAFNALTGQNDRLNLVVAFDDNDTEIPNNFKVPDFVRNLVITGSMITQVGDDFLYECRELTRIDLPQGITSVGDSFLYECRGLTRIDLPQRLTTIGNNFLFNCYRLIHIDLPQGLKELTSVGDRFLSGCSDLFRIDLPQGLTLVGDSFLSECSGLIRIDLPQGLTLVGDYFLSGCRRLTRIDLPQGLISVGRGFLLGCIGLTRIDLPQGLTSVGDYFLSGCSGLIRIDLPQGLNTIGNDFLSYCRGLTHIDLPQGLKELTSVGDRFLSGCIGLISIDLPQGLNTIGNYFLDGCSGLTSIDLPQGLTLVGDYFLSYCAGLTRIDLPQGLISVGRSFLLGCSGLTRIDLPQGLTSVGDYFLSYCSGLTRIDLPQGLTSVGDYFLFYCDGLTSINLPQGLTSVGNHFLSYCSGLTRLDLPQGLISIGIWFLYGCSGLTHIILPRNIADQVLSQYYFPIKVENQSVEYRDDGMVVVKRMQPKQSEQIAGGGALAKEIYKPDSTSSSSWWSNLKNIDWKRMLLGNPHLDDSVDPHEFPVSTKKRAVQV